tara:strand:+ start:1693 stop:2616 length:924 start_codon:yes stop_codon:yes gene_type:complete
MNILCLIPLDHVPGIKEELQSLGHLAYFPGGLNKLSVYDIAKSNNTDIIYTNPNKQKYILDLVSLENTNVKIIVTVSKGTNHIDLEYCEQVGIQVIHLGNDPVVAKSSAAAEHALGLTLALLRRLPQAFDSVKNYEWNYTNFIGHQLQSMKVGVMGMGKLGTMYANYCRAIGSEILECTRQDTDSFTHVMSNADVISLHIPLTEDTHHLINKEAISLIKPSGAFIVNTARGSIVDEKAILDGLESGQIKGYASDVLEEENNNLYENNIVIAAIRGFNIIITPHMAGTCIESAQVSHLRAIALLKNLL